MEKQESVAKKLERIEEMLETKGKKFKVPLKHRIFKRQFSKDNYALVIWIRQNGSIDIKKVRIKDNTIKVGDVYYDASASYVLRYKNYPVIIQPEWNIKPVGSETQPWKPQENIKKAINNGTLSSAEKFILHAIKMDLVKGKPKLNWGVILLILAVLGGGYLLISSLGLI